MAKLVVLITARDDVAQQVGESWMNAGAPGVTIIEGYGTAKTAKKTEMITRKKTTEIFQISIISRIRIRI